MPPGVTPLGTGWGQGRFKFTAWLLQCLVRFFHLCHIPDTPTAQSDMLKIPRNWENRTSAIPHTRNCDHTELLQNTRLQSGFFLFWPISAKLLTSPVCLKDHPPPQRTSLITEASATFMSMLVILNIWHCGRYRYLLNLWKSPQKVSEFI